MRKPVDTKKPMKLEGKPILCNRCHKAGGTLAKVDKGYQHVSCP